MRLNSIWAEVGHRQVVLRGLSAIILRNHMQFDKQPVSVQRPGNHPCRTDSMRIPTFRDLSALTLPTRSTRGTTTKNHMSDNIISCVLMVSHSCCVGIVGALHFLKSVTYKLCETRGWCYAQAFKISHGSRSILQFCGICAIVH